MNIFEAIKERNEYLRLHPELKELQSNIDFQLNNAGSKHNRLVVMRRMLNDSLTKLQKALAKF
jgi:hypothetical protein